MRKFLVWALRKVGLFGLVYSLRYWMQKFTFQTSSYWEKRYQGGGDSGAGSYNHLGRFKAELINSFVRENGIQKVIEFGCGDGHQLSLLEIPCYVGIDASSRAVAMCREKFKGDSTKEFFQVEEFSAQEKADLVLSLDVIYHLVEDENYDSYMKSIFNASSRYVIIYSSNFDSDRVSLHVRHRKFTHWTEKNAGDWKCIQTVKNEFPYEGDHLKGSHADFYIFKNC